MLRLLRQVGQADMGDATDEESVCRFWLDSSLWELAFIRAHWETLDGDGGSADLSIKVDHRDTAGLHRYLLGTVRDMGTGDNGRPDLNLRVMPRETEHWRFQGCDHLVLEWANPDTGKIRWSVEVGLKPVEGAA